MSLPCCINFLNPIFTEPTCSGSKVCLTLNNKTRNNVAKWEIKGRCVKSTTPDNFYRGLYGRFIHTFYQSKL